jgi:hypothetical protein
MDCRKRASNEILRRYEQVDSCLGRHHSDITITVLGLRSANGQSVRQQRDPGAYEANGWLAESEANYGFVFMSRDGRRILVEATPRDPHDTSVQAFSPFK